MGARTLCLAVAIASTLSASGQDYSLVDWDGDGVRDLGFVLKQGASGKTEVHISSGKTHEYILHTATALGASDANWTFLLADWDADKKADLVGILHSGGSGRTEVHVWSGASNFQQDIDHVSTALEISDSSRWAFVLADYCGTGKPDLVIVKKSQTGTGMTEVHVLSRASRLSSFALHAVTGLHEVGPDWVFGMDDIDGDHRLDLVCLVRRGGSGNPELHVLGASSGYRSFLVQRVVGGNGVYAQLASSLASMARDGSTLPWGQVGCAVAVAAFIADPEGGTKFALGGAILTACGPVAEEGVKAGVEWFKHERGLIDPQAAPSPRPNDPPPTADLPE